MPRNDDNFWLDIFKKSPLITIFMAIGGVVGLGVGIFLTQGLSWSLNMHQWFVAWGLATTGGGVFIGLILGVIADSIWAPIAAARIASREGSAESAPRLASAASLVHAGAKRGNQMMRS